MLPKTKEEAETMVSELEDGIEAADQSGHEYEQKMEDARQEVALRRHLADLLKVSWGISS